MARFGQALKPPKPPQQLSKALAPHNPPLALPSYLPIGPTNCFYWASKLLHGTFWASLKTSKTPAAPSYLPIGSSNCFYWVSKLLHGTFWAGLKTSKTPAAAFESLSTAQPSACFAIVPPHRPHKLFLLGLKLLHGTFWAGLKTSKSPQQLSKALAPHNPPLALPSYLPIGPTNCFYRASKLLHGTHAYCIFIYIYNTLTSLKHFGSNEV